MDRCILIALVVAVTAATPARGLAQDHATDAGSMRVGGSAGFSSMTHVAEVAGTRFRSTFTNVFVHPQLQYFVRPGLAVGGTLSLAHAWAGNGPSTTSYGIGPVVSYYFGAGTESAAVPYVSAQTEVHGILGEDFGHRNYGASAGLLYMINRSVGLDTSVFHRIQRATGDFPGDSRFRFSGVALGIAAFVP